jgi:23S rRNA pseudouridine2605 synthase
MARIERFITSQTELSRRRVTALIQEGKVSVNGKIIHEIGFDIDPRKDDVQVSDQSIGYLYEPQYFKFYKPKGVISTMSDPKDRVCLAQYLGKMPESLFPIGRLDRETKGLLFFTNDGEFANKVSHPSFELQKEYQVVLDKVITHNDLRRLTKGIILEDGPIKFTDVTKKGKKELVVWIAEGRNRIVRRTFSFLGYSVEKLKRTAIGPIKLEGLAEGEFSPLTKHELRLIKASFSS